MVNPEICSGSENQRTDPPRHRHETRRQAGPQTWQQAWWQRVMRENAPRYQVTGREAGGRQGGKRWPRNRKEVQ